VRGFFRGCTSARAPSKSAPAALSLSTPISSKMFSCGEAGQQHVRPRVSCQEREPGWGGARLVWYAQTSPACSGWAGSQRPLADASTFMHWPRKIAGTASHMGGCGCGAAEALQS
jgi:hypothetical protein